MIRKIKKFFKIRWYYFLVVYYREMARKEMNPDKFTCYFEKLGEAERKLNETT